MIQAEWIEYPIGSFKLPEELVNPEKLEQKEVLVKYIDEMSQKKKKKTKKMVGLLINDVEPGVLYYYDILCVSLTGSFAVLIGMELEEFSDLLGLLENSCAGLFPIALSLSTQVKCIEYSNEAVHVDQPNEEWMQLSERAGEESYP